MSYDLYFTKDMAVRLLTRLKVFENDLNDFFKANGLVLRDNLGRRNALVSVKQEVETASLLREVFETVIEDGSPGKPDVLIEDIKRELECKITSGTRSKNSVSYAFQTDYATLQKKEKLDYIYIVANEDFDSFGLYFFKDLTIDDFVPPASGSRGKSRMKKGKAFKKCTPLFGSYVVKNNVYIEKYSNEILDLEDRLDEEIITYLSKNGDALLTEVNKKVKSLEERYEKKINKLKEKIENWKSKSDQISIVLQST